MGIMTEEYHNGYQQGYKDAKEEFKNIMHKYQQIKHIVKAEIPYKLVEIEKVVEDGNVD